MKENKRIYLIVGGVVCLLVTFIIIVFIISKDNNNISDESDNNNVVENNDSNVNGVSCVEDCVEYYNLEMDTKHSLKYTDDLNIEVNVFSTSEYENSNISINVNNKEIYSVTDFTTYVKIFEFEDFYVVEYVKSQSQCGNKVDILIKEDGTLLGIAGNEFNDTFNYNDDDVVTPTIMKTEFDDENDTVIVYKEMCGMCSSEEQQIGFKYTYSLEDGTLIFKNKENIYCNN